MASRYPWKAFFLWFIGIVIHTIGDTILWHDGGIFARLFPSDFWIIKQSGDYMSFADGWHLSEFLTWTFLAFAMHSMYDYLLEVKLWKFIGILALITLFTHELFFQVIFR